jgi:predicted RNA-binding Zn-ribbon protein involved in translation (DUF1610 family)
MKTLAGILRTVPARFPCPDCGAELVELDPPEGGGEEEMEGGWVMLSAATHKCPLCGHRKVFRWAGPRSVLDLIEKQIEEEEIQWNENP